MARHRLQGRKDRLPPGMRGRAQHRAISYARELLVGKVLLWLVLRVSPMLTPPRVGGKV